MVSNRHRYFFGVSLVQAIISLVLEAYVFAKFQEDSIAKLPGDSDIYASDARTIPTYLALLIFAFVYQLLLVYDALRLKNTIQVIGLVAMNVAILIYTSIQYDQIGDAYKSLQGLNRLNIDFWGDVKPYLIALPIITAVATICLVFGAWKLYEEFAWTIYKQINTADVKLKNSYLMYQVCECPSVVQWVIANYWRVDLYCDPEVRLFLIHRLCHSIPGYCP